MWLYHVSVELCLRERYQALPLEAISEDDLLHIYIGHDKNMGLVEWHHRLSS